MRKLQSFIISIVFLITIFLLVGCSENASSNYVESSISNNLKYHSIMIYESIKQSEDSVLAKKATEIDLLTKRILLELENLKTDVIAVAEFDLDFNTDKSHRNETVWAWAKQIDIDKLSNLNDRSSVKKVMLPDMRSPSKYGEAYKIKIKLWEYEVEILSILGDELALKLDLGFDYRPTPESNTSRLQPWEYITFFNVRLIDFIMQMDRLEEEVYIAEYIALNNLVGNDSSLYNNQSQR